MKQILLAVLLIALPTSVFTVVEIWMLPVQHSEMTSHKADPLGDLSGYESIVSDTRSLVDAGKLTEAELRVTDFETKWDKAESTLRPKAPSAWGNVDTAADHVFAALREKAPDTSKVDNVLAVLSTTLANPVQSGSARGVRRVAGVAVTDSNGHAIPCETMLQDVRRALSSGSISERDKAMTLQSKAIERCNADDDTHSDQFSAQALALAK